MSAEDPNKTARQEAESPNPEAGGVQERESEHVEVMSPDKQRARFGVEGDEAKAETDDGSIDFQTPDTSTLGKPTQENTHLAEGTRSDTPAQPNSVEFKAPDMSRFGKPTQDRQPAMGEAVDSAADNPLAAMDASELKLEPKEGPSDDPARPRTIETPEENQKPNSFTDPTVLTAEDRKHQAKEDRTDS